MATACYGPTTVALSSSIASRQGHGGSSTDSSRHIRGLRYRARDQSLFVTVGIDYDGNGTFEGRTEPTRLYRVDRNAGTLTPVVADSTRRRLQSILDSRP